MSNEILAEEQTSRPIPEGENRGGPNEKRKTRRGCGGCIAWPIVMTLCVAGLVLLIDLTDSGDRVKGALLELAAKFREPAGPAEPRTVEVEKIVEKVVEKIVEVPVETKPPLPGGYVPWQKIDTAELWNGIAVQSWVNGQPGEHAAAERLRDESYQVQLQLNVKIPRASDSVEDLAKLNPDLPKMLPGLSRMVPEAKVSGFFHKLYELKQERLQQLLTRFDRTLSRHNFFDCETVLELTHPDTGKKALLLQGEMDVVSDGSDGDRWPDLDDYISMSDNYRYSTSYAWKKKTPTPNPLLSRYEEKLKACEEEFAIKGLSIERNQFLRSEIGYLKTAIGEVKARSFLIAEADPFIVVPLSMLGYAEQTPFGPAIGDYAAVIYGNRIFPVIVGDAGPTFQMGEASLRLAKEINENAGVYSRPVSDLEVTYLVFPRSGEEEWDAPDLGKWHDKVRTLIDGIGGLGEGYSLHVWEDLIAKKREAKAKAKETETAAPGEKADEAPAAEASTTEPGEAAGAPRE